MFRINAVLKASQQEGHVLKVEGVATSPVIDRDNERMSPEAISKMAEAVNKREIPIRAEHEDKFYTDIGVWKTAGIDETGRMHVYGEVDTRMSLGNDLAITLQKGKPVGLSIGGKVADAAVEWAKDVGKAIRTYKDVILEEITVTKKPSVPDADELSIAKSVQFDQSGFKTSPEGEKVEAVRDHIRKSQVQTTSENIMKAWHERNMLFVQKMAGTVGTDVTEDSPSTGGLSERKPLKNENARKVTMKSAPVGKEGTVAPDKARHAENKNESDKAISVRKSFTEVSKEIDELADKELEIEKGYCDGPCYADNCCVIAGLTPEDTRFILAATRIAANVDYKEMMEKPSKLQDWEYVDALPSESFVVEMSPGRMFPHHNPDFTVNLEWVKFWLCQLLDGQYSWLTPKEHTVALCHLYHHYKMAYAAKKSAQVDSNAPVVEKSEKTEKAHVTPVTQEDVAKMEFSQADMELFHKCYQFQVNKAGERPQYMGENGVMNDFSNADIKKMAKVYISMMQAKTRRGSLGIKMADAYRSNIAYTQKPTFPEGQTSVAKDSNSSPSSVMKTEKKTETEVETEVKKTEGEAAVEKAATPSEETAPAGEAPNTETKPAEGESAEKSAATDDTAKTEDVAKSTEKVEEKSEEVEKTEDKPAAGEAEDKSEVIKTEEDKPAEEVEKTAKTETPAAEVEKGKKMPAAKGDKAYKSEEDKETEVDVTKAAEAAATKAIETQVLPVLKTLQESVDALSKSVKDREESVAKSVKTEADARTKEMQAVQKTVSDQGASLNTLVELVGKIAKTAGTSKAVRSADRYEAVQKSFDSEANGDTPDFWEAVDKYKAENPGVETHQAVAAVKKSMAANA